MFRILMVCIFLAIPVCARGETYYVPDHYPSIQAAVSNENVGSGDTIIVRDGTYHENLNITGKNLVLQSEHGSSHTKIDGDRKGSVISFGPGVTRDFLLKGFTLSNGLADMGGGIKCSGCAPTIKENSITGNTALKGGGIACIFANPLIATNELRGNFAISKHSASAFGAGIYSVDSNPAIIANVIQENYSDSGYGCGICCESGLPSIKGNLITGNRFVVLGVGGGICLYDISETVEVRTNHINYNQASMGGGIACYSSEALLINNLIHDNAAEWGGGIFCNGRNLLLQNCTVTQNEATTGNIGGGVYCLTNSNIKNSIIWDNTSYEVFGGAGTSITYSLVEVGFQGAGNLTGDPMFLDPDNDDFHLTAASPCINAAIKEDAPGLDFDYEQRPQMGTVDIGCDEHSGDHQLSASKFKVHLAGGEAVGFDLKARPEDAGRTYYLLGTVSGTWPGTPLPGGYATLRLNWDLFTESVVLTYINTYLFVDFMGTLDGNAEALAIMNVPPLPSSSLAMVMQFAFVVGKPYDFTSNPVPVKVVY